MKNCPKCHGKIKERVDDFTKMGICRPGIFKRNKVWECQNKKCGELWYEGKPNVADVNPIKG